MFDMERVFYQTGSIIVELQGPTLRELFKQDEVSRHLLSSVLKGEKKPSEIEKVLQEISPSAGEELSGIAESASGPREFISNLQIALTAETLS
ncbi:MAG: hypothetical protein DHS20C02_14560 [Micavibrio sp.]|nr:MAG: hypothetical protein DHS20C02_14560 [Micavibrio sp.]